MIRKIIQITTKVWERQDGPDIHYPVVEIVALCNDGTVWQRDNMGSGWIKIEEIPQE